ncbi:zinc-binding dehydrogenase [Solwaraspora sp. WMMD1047]|uniref:zinc-binding dehydrogenase n=1 Tax=Solwaraspora sp. WMMD1047 TaxID=3016102 RepID=UPI002416E3BE|nr:zinc-binding dehydrogenase [Solwaraspora sp. WMMD1047]MDG4834873.1 zinc-binding dehydrogenase [Solwaraspora sp. WMMD1047]
MPFTTRAAVLETAGQPLRIRDITLTDPGPGEVLVRTVSTGICGTDVHFADGMLPYPLPTVLGHEAAGTVEAVGDGDHGITVGTRVIVCDQTFCGHCPSCLSGQMVYCADRGAKQRQRRRLALDDQPMRQYLGVSSFAELMLVDAHNLLPMPDALSFDAAALLSCCLTTGLAAVFNVARPAPGSRIAIIGCGGVGLGAVQAARIAGAAQIIAIDPQQHRRDLATRLGATDTIDPDQDDTITAVIEASGGGVDRAVEAVGLPTTAAQAFSVLLPGGHATVLGMMPPGTDIALPGRLLRQGRSIGGTIMGSVRTPADIPRYADLAVRGTLRTDDLVTSRRPLPEVNAALADARSHHGVRAVLAF